MHGEFSRFALPVTDVQLLQRKMHIDAVQKRLQELTPGGRRLLLMLLNAYNLNYGCALNRKEVAAVLARPNGLTPHDRKLLNRLCELGFIVSKRHTLYTPERYACGAEFRYTMDEDMAWILNHLRKRSNKRRKRQVG